MNKRSSTFEDLFDPEPERTFFARLRKQKSVQSASIEESNSAPGFWSNPEFELQNLCWEEESVQSCLVMEEQQQQQQQENNGQISGQLGSIILLTFLISEILSIHHLF